MSFGIDFKIVGPATYGLIKGKARIRPPGQTSKQNAKSISLGIYQNAMKSFSKKVCRSESTLKLQVRPLMDLLKVKPGFDPPARHQNKIQKVFL